MPNGSRCQFSAARRQLVERALKVRTVDECKLAITGLSRSDYHVQGGYLDLKYALLGGGRSPSVEATIDRLVAVVRNGSNGNGNGERRYFGGRLWRELSTGEQTTARDLMARGIDPATYVPDVAERVNGNGEYVTAETLLD